MVFLGGETDQNVANQNLSVFFIQSVECIGITTLTYLLCILTKIDILILITELLVHLLNKP